MAPQRRRATSEAARIAALSALAVVVLLGPELMAGSTAPTAVAIVLLAPFAAILASVAFARTAPSIREPVIAVLLATVAWIAVQSLPVPIEVADAALPDAANGARAAAAVVGNDPPSWAALTVSPLATRRELAEALAMLTVLLAAWSASSAGDRLAVVRIAAFSVIVLEAVVLVHAILDLREPFGLVPAPHWNPAFIGPILNQNMLAGVLAAGVPLMIACGVEADRPQQRWAWLAVALATALMTVLCRSRGGILSLGVGVVTIVFLLRRQPDTTRASKRRSALLLAAGLLAIATTAAFAIIGDAMIVETARGLPKLELFAQSLDLVPRAPWLGVGRGGYAASFVGIHGGIERPEHPENLLIEWGIELGVPLLVALVVVIGGATLRALRAARSTAQLGALAALLSLLVHDQFDFALEMVGIGVFGAALLGSALAPSSSRTSESPPSGRRVSPAVIGLVALGVSALVAEPVLARSVSRLRADLTDAIRARRWGDVDRLTAVAITTHPSEPVFPLLIGHASLLQDRDDTLRWLNRAMVLAPEWYEPHHLAARWLAGRGAVEQAWLEVREVRRLERTRAYPAACAVASRRGSSGSALRVLRDEPELLESLVACSAPEDAAAIDDALVERGQTGPLVRRAYGDLAAGRVEAAFAVLDRLDPDDDRVAIARADALTASGRASEAVEVLQARLGTSRTREVIERLGRAQAAAGDEDGMRATAEELMTIDAATPGVLMRQRMFLAELELARGNQARAVRALEDAHAMDPSGPALARILDVALQMGDGRRAHLARQELCRRDGPTSPHCADASERPDTAAQLPTLP